jgi:hypothetical protein
MKEQIRFGLVKTVEELERLKQFAATFDHAVGDNSMFPIYTVERGEQLIGYYNLINFPVPVVCPAMHPDICTPRDFRDSLEFVKHHFCLNSINGNFPHGTCLLAVPPKLPFSPSAFERSGFKRTGLELWQIIL